MQSACTIAPHIMAQDPTPSAPDSQKSPAETSKIATKLPIICSADRNQSVPMIQYSDTVKAATVDLQLADWDMQWHLQLGIQE